MITWISIAIIVGVAIYYAILLIKLNGIKKSVDTFSLDGDNDKLNSLAEEYRQGLTITDGKQETNTTAALVINEANVCKCCEFNIKQLDAAAGTLVGLGLLGTFLGLTLGINGFDDSSTDTIQRSIQRLLGGMSTAFVTSLVGMFLSLCYTFADKWVRNKFACSIDTLCAKLDKEYYIDDTVFIQRAIANQSILHSTEIKSTAEKVEKIVGAMCDQLKQSIQQALTYEREGEQIPIVNILRELLTESSEQSKALKSFSTDLAIELNNGFDEMLSRQLQARLIPLMENIDATTRRVIENIDTTTQTMVAHIDQVAENMSAPVSDMMTSTTDGLKDCLQNIMSEFKSSISEETTHELDNVAAMLSNASQSMKEFPATIQQLSQLMQSSISEVRQAVNEITTGSVNASEQQMRKMNENMANAQLAITAVIERMQQAMEQSQASQQQSNQAMTNSLTNTTESVQQMMADSMKGIQQHIEQSMNGMVANIGEQQTNVIALHEEAMDKMQQLLQHFDESVGQMSKANEATTHTLDALQQSHTSIANASNSMKDVAEAMNTTSSHLHQSQQDFAKGTSEANKATQQTIGSLTEMMNKTGEMSQEYIEYFDVLKDGIGDVFSKLKQGLDDYSAKVRETTKKYLDDYSTALTNTVEQISNTVGELKDIADSLEETASKMKK